LRSEEPIRVVIVCPGLGLEMRGFERAAREWFDALGDRGDLDLWLVKGHGPIAGRELRARTVARSAWISTLAARLLGKRDFWLEEVMFAATLQPILMRLRPDVVMLSGLSLVGALGRVRQLARQRFRILLSNGAPLLPPFPYGVDHVQQVTPFLAELAVRAGVPPQRQTVLPYAFTVPPKFDPPSAGVRAQLRRALGLPPDRRILLTVGAINSGHKRMDYVIREVSSLGEDKPFLVMLGAHDGETPSVVELARKLLGSENFTARTVELADVADYYRAADAFVLASVLEGFGLAYAEALQHGLPVIAHDFPTARFVLGEHGYRGDLTKPGALATMLAGFGDDDDVERRGRDRHRSVYERFSWDALAPDYVKMLHAVAGRAS
jgi:1,2-diacylglycerol 3-alpha-glucosyltransferase